MALQSDYTRGQSFIQDGKNYTVVTNCFESDFITVTDEAGNIIRQRKSLPILQYQAKKDAERKEQIAYYQAQGQEAHDEKLNWLGKIKEYFTKMRGVDKGTVEYGEYKDQYWAARFAKTAASNREHSAYLSAFMVASDAV